MMKISMMVAAGLVAGVALADIEVTVDPSVTVGPIKPMHAVNNGPTKARKDQSRGTFQVYKDARIPFARTHDSYLQATSHGHTVDISAVFPDFDADENDPKNYDFGYTDAFLRNIMDAGTEVFFRLGQTIENGQVKKYHVFPPKDFAKWARICEHVIRHCNEGWCDGYKWDIRYWEIWNEADAELDENRAKSAQWQGTKAQFFEFYKVVAQHLKKTFPGLRIGGPALGWRLDWADEFLAYQEKAGTPVDFFSWHCYARQIKSSPEKCRIFRALLDKHGYTKAESILDEWNYVKGWTDDFPYTSKVISEAKGGAFAAAIMCACQDEPVDMLMYYDARPGTIFNGMFDIYTYEPRPAYWAFVDWSRLARLGTQVKSAVSFPGQTEILAKADEQAKWEFPPIPYQSLYNVTNQEVFATAAVSKAGRLGVMVVRYTDDDNLTASEKLTVRILAGRAFGAETMVLRTDDTRANSCVWKDPEADGSLVLSLPPNSFVYIEDGRE